jgi:hypothetical protein
VPRPFVAADVVGLAFAGLGLVWSIAAAFYVAPIFAGMFADFSCCLPEVTGAWLLPWLNLALGLVPFAIVLPPWVLRARRRSRAVAMSGAIAWVVLQPVIFFAVMYLPLFNLAEAML